jgi:hypothetical protein
MRVCGNTEKLYTPSPLSLRGVVRQIHCLLSIYLRLRPRLPHRLRPVSEAVLAGDPSTGFRVEDVGLCPRYRVQGGLIRCRVSEISER